jgi:phage protein D
MTLAGVYAPDFAISLNGQSLSADLRGSVTSVEYEEGIDGADRAQVVFANPGLRHLDNPLFRLDAGLDLSMGYRDGGIVRLFQGEVTGVEPAFPASEMPTVTLVAHNFMHRLQEGTKTRQFPWYLPDAVVAAIVSAENFLLPDIDPAAAGLTALGMISQRPRPQHKKSDYEFLRQIAAEYGFDMWLDGRIFHFRLLLPMLPPPTVELRYGESLVDFRPRHTNVGLAVGVTVKVWVSAIKTELAVSASWDGDSVSVRIAPAFLGGGGTGATLDLPDLPMDSPVDAVKWVFAELRRRINNRTTGSGSAVGDPRLRAGDTVILAGIGPFSGPNYRLTSVSHVLDAGGYRTRFEVRRELI